MPEMSFADEAEAVKLFRSWVSAFGPMDDTLSYTHVETARVLPLSPDILLAGIIDAEGEDFFSEHKTSSPRDQKYWKRQWLLSVQALTYGLLTGGKGRFLVRKVFKLATPVCDHEWFQFTQGDLRMWYRQVVDIGETIVRQRAAQTIPWLMNVKHGCFAYGPSYACPYYAHCASQQHDTNPEDAGPHEFFPEFTGANRELLLNTLTDMSRSTGRTPIVLSATRIENYLRCPEKYRRDQLVSFPPSSAMLIGSQFHRLVARYYEGRIKP